MAKVERFEDLKVWQESRILIGFVFNLMRTNKDYGFKDQIQRASISIMNNIAEGFERSSDAEFKRFLDIVKASCGEVRSMLYLAEDLRNRCRFLSGSISNLMKYLRK